MWPTCKAGKSPRRPSHLTSNNHDLAEKDRGQPQQRQKEPRPPDRSRQSFRKPQRVTAWAGHNNAAQSRAVSGNRAHGQGACADDKNPFLFEQALTIAENQLILQCVRAERVAAIERLRDGTATPLTRDNSLAVAKARFRKAQFEFERLIQAKAENSANSAGNSTSNAGGTEDSTHKQQNTATEPACEPKSIGPRDEFDAMRCAMPDLDRLERYERRAWSRRKRAIRDFIAIKSRSDG
jgi:hypothetical protein